MSLPNQNIPIAYCSSVDLISILNLQQTTFDPTKYLVWQIPISTDVLNTFVKYANQQATILYGNLTNSPLFGLANQWATWRAVLNMIDTMTINWTISGLPANVGDISISRLEGMAAASETIRLRAETELTRLYTLLSQIDPIQNFRPPPYFNPPGQSFFS